MFLQISRVVSFFFVLLVKVENIKLHIIFFRNIAENPHVYHCVLLNCSGHPESTSPSDRAVMKVCILLALVVSTAIALLGR